MKKLSMANLQNVWHVDNLDELLLKFKNRSTLLFVKHLDEYDVVSHLLKTHDFTVRNMAGFSPLVSVESNVVLMSPITRCTGYRVCVDQVAFYKAPIFDMVRQGQARAPAFHNEVTSQLSPVPAYIYHPTLNGQPLTSSMFGAL